jgi:hypothetical protein
LGALGTTLYIYAYFPYLAASLGPTAPLLGTCFGMFYGLMKFSESDDINSIELVTSGEHNGKVRISIAKSPIVSSNIIVDIRDIRTLVNLSELSEGKEENLAIVIKKHINQSDN